jgi:hypothetical protein
MVVRLDSACNDGAEEHNVSVFKVTTVSSRQWCNVMKENVSDEMVWSDLANHTKEKWQKAMELSSTTGSGLWEGRLWNTQLKLAQDNPVPSSPTNSSQTFTHNWNTFFLPHHFSFNENWSSDPENEGSAFLWDNGRFNHNKVQKLKRWPSSIKILQNEVVLLYWHCKWLWIPTAFILCDAEGLNSCDYSDLVSLDGTLCSVVDMYQCGRRTCCLHLQCCLMTEAVGSSRIFGTCLLPHCMASHPIKPLSQTTPCTKGILQCMHTSSNSYWCIRGVECQLAGCRLKTTCAEKENVKTWMKHKILAAHCFTQ